MEGMVINAETFKGRSILVTGHTGFKGSWLTLWLHQLGARVTGLALDPLHEGDAFNAMRLHELCEDIRQEINDYDGVCDIIRHTGPEVVFHLAAQPIVLDALNDPLYTIRTNTLGTANLLEACRHTGTVRAVIVITTDKVYYNSGSGEPFRETDRLGGNDIYSASKSAAELIAEGYLSSFGAEGGYALATARAGNVIGGGDWSAHRIIPDCVRSAFEGRPVELRNPDAIRPWQHVLEPLAGYLLLAAKLLSDPSGFCGPWNFGPGDGVNRRVSELTEHFFSEWGKEIPEIMYRQAGAHGAHGVYVPHEADFLSISSEKAIAQLDWRPRLSFIETVHMTAEWYKAQKEGEDMRKFSIRQIRYYEEKES